jgi:hypothetical protein
MAGFKSVWATLTTDVRSTDVEGIGRIRWEDDKAFRWVNNPITNFTPGPGDLVCHTFTNGTLNTELGLIDKPATALLGLLAGVSVATIAANTGTTPNTYGWIQVWGHHSAVNVTPANTQTTAAPVAGNALIAVNAVQTYAATGDAMGTAPRYTRRLLLLDSVAGSTAVQACAVLVQCL